MIQSLSCKAFVMRVPLTAHMPIYMGVEMPQIKLHIVLPSSKASADMTSFAHEQHPSNHCKFLPCFAYPKYPKVPSNQCKFFPALISETCCRCQGFCFRTPSSLSSEGDDPDSNLDNRHVIILEIQSRAMKAKPRPKEYLFAESLWWVVSATTGKSLTSTKEEWEEEDACDDGTETFYSVKSCLSQCSSEGGSELKELRRRSVWDEFRHYEGWPFGLCRRAVMLPPLPSSPSDSWTWRKRTHAAKTCAIN